MCVCVLTDVHALGHTCGCLLQHVQGVCYMHSLWETPGKCSCCSMCRATAAACAGRLLQHVQGACCMHSLWDTPGKCGCCCQAKGSYSLAMSWNELLLLLLPLSCRICTCTRCNALQVCCDCCSMLVGRIPPQVLPAHRRINCPTCRAVTCVDDIAHVDTGVRAERMQTPRCAHREVVDALV